MPTLFPPLLGPNIRARRFEIQSGESTLKIERGANGNIDFKHVKRDPESGQIVQVTTPMSINGVTGMMQGSSVDPLVLTDDKVSADADLTIGADEHKTAPYATQRLWNVGTNPGTITEDNVEQGLIVWHRTHTQLRRLSPTLFAANQTVPNDAAAFAAALVPLEPELTIEKADVWPFFEVDNISEWRGVSFIMAEAFVELPSAGTYTFAMEINGDNAEVAAQVHVSGTRVLHLNSTIQYGDVDTNVISTTPLNLTSGGNHTVEIRMFFKGRVYNTNLVYWLNDEESTTTITDYKIPPLTSTYDRNTDTTLQQTRTSAVQKPSLSGIHRIAQWPLSMVRREDFPSALRLGAVAHDAAGNMTIVLSEDNDDLEETPMIVQTRPEEVKAIKCVMHAIMRYDAVGNLKWIIKNPLGNVDDNEDKDLFLTGVEATRDGGVLAQISGRMYVYSNNGFSVVHLGDATGTSAVTLNIPGADNTNVNVSILVKYTAIGGIEWAVYAAGTSDDDVGGVLIDACEIPETGEIVAAFTTSPLSGGGNGFVSSKTLIVDGIGQRMFFPALDSEEGSPFPMIPAGSSAMIGYVLLSAEQGAVKNASFTTMTSAPDSLMRVFNNSNTARSGLTACPSGGFISHFMSYCESDQYGIMTVSAMTGPGPFMNSGLDEGARSLAFQVVCRHDANMDAVWCAQIFGRTDKSEDETYYLNDTRSECFVDSTTGDVTVLFHSINGNPVTIIDGQGSQSTVTVPSEILSMSSYLDEEDDVSYAGVAKFTSNGSLVWAKIVGVSATIGTNETFFGERYLHGCPDGSVMTLIWAPELDMPESEDVEDGRGMELVWLDTVSGEARGSPWPLTGVQRYNDDAWDSHVSFSRGPSRYANIVVRSDRHTGYLDAPDILGDGPENVIDIPYGLSIVGLDFTPVKKRVVIDGDLVVLGTTISHNPASTSMYTFETTAARRARIAYSVTEAYGACGVDTEATCAQDAVIPWVLSTSPLERKGTLLALNGSSGILLDSSTHVFTVKTPGIYSICVHALGTSRAAIDAEFAWALRCTTSGESTPKTVSLATGASGVQVSLDANDTFVLVSKTNASVTFMEYTELRVQMISALVNPVLLPTILG